MFAFNVLSLLLSIFDLKRKKKKRPYKIKSFLNLFSFSVIFCLAISLHQISCHTETDQVSLKSLFSSSNLPLHNTLPTYVHLQEELEVEKSSNRTFANRERGKFLS